MSDAMMKLSRLNSRKFVAAVALGLAAGAAFSFLGCARPVATSPAQAPVGANPVSPWFADVTDEVGLDFVQRRVKLGAERDLFALGGQDKLRNGLFDDRIEVGRLERQLDRDAGDPMYRIKSDGEKHERVAAESELTLSAFLEFVDTAQAAERQEWSPVQPSGEDSVKVMTVHQAKGLEFDTVFVPGLAEGILPDLTIQHNPVERGKSLDFELRGDRDILPSFERLHRVLARFKEALKEQEGIEERRTFYVALTRARRRLYVTGAHWYGDEVSKPKKPSAFFDELAAWAASSGHAAVEPGDGPAQDNPLTGYRQRFVRDWPGPARPSDADVLFPQGWRSAALAAGTRGVMGGDLSPEDRAAFEAASSENRLLAVHLLERERESPDGVHERSSALIAMNRSIRAVVCAQSWVSMRIRRRPAAVSR
jgi:hypothetical protein